MCEIVPEFCLSNIRIIFGDKFITESLLQTLGIENTAILQCDYWHQVTQVWPSQTNFGQVVMKQMVITLLEC